VKSGYAGYGYDISIGVGKTFHARTPQEIVYALAHYFRVNFPEYTGDPDKPFDYQKHLDHAKECDCCPLCRETK